MKPHHSAALALLLVSICACSRKPSVSWYRILPPQLWQNNPIAESPFELDTRAPLSQWEFVAWSDSAKQCRAYSRAALPGLEKALFAMMKDRSEGEKQMADAILKKQLDKSQCVASTDPRMKGIRTPTPSQIGR